MEQILEPVVGYIRVSTEEQKLHGYSVKAQKMKLQDYADTHNMVIIRFYIDEGVSGTLPIKKRPNLQKMIRDAENEETRDFKRILMVKLDRFFRNVAEYHECMKRIYPVTWKTTEEDYDAIVNANLKGYFFGAQAAARLMIKNECKGSMILIGSVHSRGAIGNRIPYAISKGGIEVLGRNSAYELGKYGIRVNCVVCGAIVNDKFIEQTEEEKNARRANWPLGRESYPEDVAKAVFFLASDEAKTITGTSLVVDSGVSACMLKYDPNWETVG